MKFSWMIQLILGISFIGLSANAGQTLHLKAGKVSVENARVGADQNTIYHIVQFNKHITANDKKLLKSLNIKTIRYIPDDALLVQASKYMISKISQSSTINMVVPYAPAFKISPSVGVIDHLNKQALEQIIVRVLTPEALKGVEQKILDQQMGLVRFAKGQHIGLVMQLSKIQELANIDGVEWIEPYPKFEFSNFKIQGDKLAASAENIASLDGYESGTKLMNFESAWDRGFTGKNQLVGFADTGLESGSIQNIHPDFKGQVKKGYAYALLSFSWEDPMGHGTHVAGSIAGNGASSNGTLKGGAFDSQLIAGGMWSKLIDNMMPPQDITKMFKDAYNDGARIHTNSWGSPRDLGAYDQFAATVDEYMWAQPDMLVMFAAGNSGLDTNSDGRVDQDSIGTPATAKNVLSVGASENKVSNGGIQRTLGELKNQDGTLRYPTEPLFSDQLSDDPNGIAAFSSRGPTDDGRIKPDVVAPGTNILSVRSQVEGASELWGCMNQDYCWSGGTSMSTPLVAGAASVLRQYLSDTLNMRTPSSAMVKALLMHTATDMYPGQYGAVGKDNGQEMLEGKPNVHQGFGLVDMNRATELKADFIHDEVRGVASGETMSFEMNVVDGAMITMTYTDAPAAAGASKTLVNNLDITVRANGAVIAQGTDRTNNFEYIDVAGVNGTITVEVKGANVPTPRSGGKLPFALVVSSRN